MHRQFVLICLYSCFLQQKAQKGRTEDVRHPYVGGAQRISYRKAEAHIGASISLTTQEKYLSIDKDACDKQIVVS